jgi:DNA-binding response OmpR family regulator
VARVGAVLRRKRKDLAEEASVISVRELIVDVNRREVFVGENQVNLTAAEFKLLETLARAPGRVFTRSELVERAFGYDYEGLERTVDAHIMNLRKKIQSDRRAPSLIRTVFGVGYKISVQNDVS